MFATSTVPFPHLQQLFGKRWYFSMLPIITTAEIVINWDQLKHKKYRSIEKFDSLPFALHRLWIWHLPLRLFPPSEQLLLQELLLRLSFASLPLCTSRERWYHPAAEVSGACVAVYVQVFRNHSRWFHRWRNAHHRWDELFIWAHTQQWCWLTRGCVRDIWYLENIDVFIPCTKAQILVQ